MNELATAQFLISINQNKDAKKVLDVMKPYCVTAEQMDAVGKLYSDIKSFADCLELAKRMHALSKDPKLQYQVRSNIIRSYLNLNKPLNALEYILINERYDPKDHANQMEKALALFYLNRKSESELVLRKILTEPRTDDIDARVKFNLGTYELATGDFQAGLKYFLLEGRRFNTWNRYKLPIENMWEGPPQPGKTILVCAEGGIGDEFISVRFMKHLQDAGMNPIFFTDLKDLASIFNRNGFKTVTSLNEYRNDWLWTYSMPVPIFLDLNEDQLWYGSYIKPLQKAKQLDGKLKIGIKCAGNPYYEHDLHRSIPAKEIIDCLPKDATIYSFHIDEDIGDERAIPLKNSIRTWDDTLDYLDQMDLVISSCTSLAHAASAMGKQTIVMVPILNYYVWARPTKHSKWYSENTTIVRQTEYNNWNSAISELKDYIDERYNSQD
jgi:hypothetical protein